MTGATLMTVSPGDPLAQHPQWFQDLNADLSAGVAHTFILHGNVHDYVEGVNLMPRDYLAVTLRGLFTVATYAPDEGLTFPGTSAVAKPAEARFRKMTGQEAPSIQARPAPAPAQGLRQRGCAASGPP